MKDLTTLPSMFNATHMKKQALIIGAIDGIGQAFARMAASREKYLLLVDSTEMYVKKATQQLRNDFPDHVIRSLVEDLSGFDSAETIYESVLFSNAFTSVREDIDMLINVVEFTPPTENMFELDEENFGKNLDFLTLQELNSYFGKLMLKQGHGEILNVLSGPKHMSELELAYYKDLERMIMTYSKGLNAKWESKGLSIHALSYSGAGLIFLSPDATAAPGQAQSSYSLGYVQELLMHMSQDS
ncbi:MAG: SDR family NAD(P)-dependent oxidoreductase [Bacteroidota bacterium]